MANWVRPEDVDSPKKYWRLHRVVANRGPGEYALAIGLYTDSSSPNPKPRVAIRWNGTDESPRGHPSVRKFPTYFMLPEDFHEHAVDFADADKKAEMRTFLGLP